ncbi:hypothetical protein ABFV83_00080 [Lacrimispora sp. BS-2]|uniref:Uncharacterized protein n=1 Tax=Lacrimispora sp. BS-2 TaxID=3151850 RepID=A0AAU7PPP9_9FIRM
MKIKRMKNKSLLALCMGVIIIFAFSNIVYAETINGYTREDFLSSYYGLPPEEWTDSGTYSGEDGGTYAVGKYNAEIDRRTVRSVYGGKYSGQVGYADANMNMVIPFTDKWDSVEDFYKGRAMTTYNDRGVDASGKYYSYDMRYLIDVNGNVLNEIKLKYSGGNFDYNARGGSLITSDGEKYYYQISGFEKPKESAGLDVEVIKYSDGSYYNHFYSFTDYPFLIDRYKEGTHGNSLMLSDFDKNGVAELKCYDTDSWEYHQPVGIGDSGWSYTRTITLGKITIWGTVMQ